MDFSCLKEDTTKHSQMFSSIKDNVNPVLRKNAVISNLKLKNFEEKLHSFENKEFQDYSLDSMKSNNYLKEEEKRENLETNLQLKDKNENSKFKLTSQIIDNLDSGKTSEGISSIYDYSIYDAPSNEKPILNLEEITFEQNYTKTEKNLKINEKNYISSNTDSISPSTPINKALENYSGDERELCKKICSNIISNRDCFENNKKELSFKEIKIQKTIEEKKNTDIEILEQQIISDLKSSSSSLIFSKICSETIEKSFQSLPSDDNDNTESKNESFSSNNIGKENLNESCKSEILKKNMEYSVSDILHSKSSNIDTSVSSISNAYQQKSSTKKAIIKSNTSSDEQLEENLSKNSKNFTEKTSSLESANTIEEQLSIQTSQNSSLLSIQTSKNSSLKNNLQVESIENEDKFSYIEKTSPNSSEYFSNEIKKQTSDLDYKINNLSTNSSQNTNINSSIPSQENYKNVTEDDSVRTDYSITEEVKNFY